LLLELTLWSLAQVVQEPTLKPMELEEMVFQQRVFRKQQNLAVALGRLMI
jgi:hypothetical protein